MGFWGVAARRCFLHNNTFVGTRILGKWNNYFSYLICVAGWELVCYPLKHSWSRAIALVPDFDCMTIRMAAVSFKKPISSIRINFVNIIAVALLQYSWLSLLRPNLFVRAEYYYCLNGWSLYGNRCLSYHGDEFLPWTEVSMEICSVFSIVMVFCNLYHIGFKCLRFFGRFAGLDSRRGNECFHRYHFGNTCVLASVDWLQRYLGWIKLWVV